MCKPSAEPKLFELYRGAAINRTYKSLFNKIITQQKLAYFETYFETNRHHHITLPLLHDWKGTSALPP